VYCSLLYTLKRLKKNNVPTDSVWEASYSSRIDFNLLKNYPAFFIAEILILLAKKEDIIRALHAPKARNWLLNNLNQKQGTKEDQYRFSLAWLLGSFLRLNEIDVIKYPLLIVLYHCILFLENQMRLMTNNHPETALIIKNSVKKLLFHVNEFYPLYSESPETVQSLWQGELFKLQKTLSMSAEISAACNQCLQELALLKMYSIHLPIKFLPLHNTLASFAMKIVFGPREVHALFPHYYNHMQIKHLFIPNELGELLDGYLFKKEKNKKGSVVLYLFNQMVPEHPYIFLNASAYNNLFNADVFFLKTRDKSLRTQTMPTTVENLSQDILAVAHFFQERGQQIILYGLCGAVAPMVHAAKQLHKEGKSFKLIADRFADSFNNIASPKNSVRMFKMCFREARQTNTSSSRKLLFFILAFLLAPATVLLIYLSAFFLLPLIKGRQNYGDYIRALPMQNILALQARGPKRIGNAPRVGDVIIPTKHELRKSTSVRRKQQKFLLLSLSQSVSEIISYLEISCPMWQPLVNFRYFFGEVIKLIENEKLTSQAGIQNIHSHHLFWLTTRNQLAPAQLIQGFLYPRALTINWSSFPAYDLEHIHNCLTHMRSHIKKPIINYSTLSSALFDFLNRVYQNADFLSYMAKRLAGSGVFDISSSIQVFLEEGLLTTIKTDAQDELKYKK